MMKEYYICDLNKSMLAANTMIEAKSPLEAAKKYIKKIGENKTVTRDLLNHGRLVVSNGRSSYVYKVD